MKQSFYDALTDCPVVAAIKDDKGLYRCLESEIKIVFILYGDIVRIADIVDCIKEKGKLAVVHMDLVTGLSGKEVAVDFIKKSTRADGIISTKLYLIRRARELDLVTILRLFAIDSMAFDNIKKQYEAVLPDIVEILPGIMPRIIKKITHLVPSPVIAGGMIVEKSDVIAAIDAGAISISSTNQDIWFI